MQVAQWLHSVGAAVGALDDAGCCPLHFACAAGFEAVALWLLESKVSSSLPNPGRTRSLSQHSLWAHGAWRGESGCGELTQARGAGMGGGKQGPFSCQCMGAAISRCALSQLEEGGVGVWSGVGGVVRYLCWADGGRARRGRGMFIHRLHGVKGKEV